MRKASTRLAFGLIAILLAGCAKPPTPNLSALDSSLAPRVSLTTVPFHPQTERDDCGPAALAMMLGSSGLKTDPKTLAPSVYTPGREGTLQSDIIQAARREGRLPVQIRSFGDLLTELDAGNPVLVLQNLGVQRWPIWHYAVAMGYDLESRTLFLHSGKTAGLKTTFADFKSSWELSENWALTVTKPGHLPATLDEAEGLKAANSLEKADQSAAAAAAYRALLERWPNSLPALMGFGNARYAAGDVKAASKIFRHAVTLFPRADEAWNNLAVSLSEQGRREDALKAAREAVRIGGPHLAAALKTLAEIENSAT